MVDPLERRAFIANAWGSSGGGRGSGGDGDAAAPAAAPAAAAKPLELLGGWADAVKGWVAKRQDALSRGITAAGLRAAPAKAAPSRRRPRRKRGDADMQRAIERSKADAHKRLKKVLDLYQVRLRSVVGDGNCQFRALSLGLHGREDLHGAIRGKVVDQLREQPELYEPFVSGAYPEYIARMALDAEWGDHVTLQAACDAFCREIHVLTDQPGSECVVLSPRGDHPPEALQKPICLTLVTEVHYDAAEAS